MKGVLIMKNAYMYEYKWVIMLADGHIIEGEGNEKMLITAMKTPGIVDGDVMHCGTWHNMDFWKFLIK